MKRSGCACSPGAPPLPRRRARRSPPKHQGAEVCRPTLLLPDHVEMRQVIHLRAHLAEHPASWHASPAGAAPRHRKAAAAGGSGCCGHVQLHWLYTAAWRCPSQHCAAPASIQVASSSASAVLPRAASAKDAALPRHDVDVPANPTAAAQCVARDGCAGSRGMLPPSIPMLPPSILLRRYQLDTRTGFTLGHR